MKSTGLIFFSTQMANCVCFKNFASFLKHDSSFLSKTKFQYILRSHSVFSIQFGLFMYLGLLLFSHSVVSNSFATPWTIACQAPLSMGLSKQEYQRGLSFPLPGYLPDPGIEPMSPASASRLFTTEPPGKPWFGATTTLFW